MSANVRSITAMKTPPQITGRIERITPAIAAEYLANKMINRTIKEGRLALYTQELRTGAFDTFNGEGIVLNRLGRLEGGQHRLEALIKTGLPYIDMFVVRGVEPGAGKSHDQGAVRTAADVASQNGYSDSRVLMAAARWLYAYDREWPSGLAKKSALGNTTLSAYLDNNKHLVVANEEVRQHYPAAARLLMNSIATFVRVVTDTLSTRQSDLFFSVLQTGEAPPEARVVLRLRDKLLARENARNRLKPPEIIVLAARTWNAMREGRDLSKLYVSRDIHGDDPYRTAPRFE